MWPITLMFAMLLAGAWCLWANAPLKAQLRMDGAGAGARAAGAAGAADRSGEAGAAGAGAGAAGAGAAGAADRSGEAGAADWSGAAGAGTAGVGYAEAASGDLAGRLLADGLPNFSISIDVADVADTRYLELIGIDNPIGAEPDEGLVVPAWPAAPVSTTAVALHETALDAVCGLFAAARDAGVGPFFVSSGYRGYDAQKQVYDDAADKSTAQPPGHSEHQSGLAADILAVGVPQPAMAGSDEARWLADNAWKHGLALRYAEDKRGITGIAYEPWHFRYIGQPHAWYCWQYNLCLEEYLQFLRSSGGYRAEVGGVSYAVLYEAPPDYIINVPESQQYSVSGDNAGGYAITAVE